LKPKIDLKHLPIPALAFSHPSKLEILCLAGPKKKGKHHELKCADEAGNQTKAIRRALTWFIGGATPSQRLPNSTVHLPQTPPISNPSPVGLSLLRPIHSIENSVNG
jgi:hypothetical protein